METVNLRIANWEGSEVDETCYSTSIKVPCKLELLNLLPSHLENLQYNVKFNTGMLSKVDHSILICIFRDHHEPKIGVFIFIEPKLEKITHVKMIEISYITSGETSIEDSFTKCDPPKDLRILSEQSQSVDIDRGKGEFWLSKCGWHDMSVLLFLTFHITSRSPPKIVNEDEDQFTPLKTSNSFIHTKEYFLNEIFSDITILCQTTKFPAHQMILSSRVKYFESMLASNMKESKEKVIRMNDMDPDSCKELLRFIYQGKVDNLANCVRELYIASDKYGMEELKGLCERHLFNHLNFENAIEVYDLSHMHGSPVLEKRAKEIILWNKDKFASDGESLKNFTIKYPDLVFELLKM